MYGNAYQRQTDTLFESRVESVRQTITILASFLTLLTDTVLTLRLLSDCSSNQTDINIYVCVAQPSTELKTGCSLLQKKKQKKQKTRKQTNCLSFKQRVIWGMCPRLWKMLPGLISQVKFKSSERRILWRTGAAYRRRPNPPHHNSRDDDKEGERERRGAVSYTHLTLPTMAVV